MQGDAGRLRLLGPLGLGARLVPGALVPLRGVRTQALLLEDVGEMWGRCGEIQGRCRGDMAYARSRSCSKVGLGLGPGSGLGVGSGFSPNPSRRSSTRVRVRVRGRVRL